MMMWNKRRSILLSKIFVILFLAVIVGCMVGGPWLVEWVIGRSIQNQAWREPWFYVTIYVGGGLSVLLLVQLFRVLLNLGRGIVFDRKNVSLLRMISWLCLVGGVLCLASAIYYLPWLIVCLVGIFVGLIVRIVKNVMAEAISLKEENDYTI